AEPARVRRGLGRPFAGLAAATIALVVAGAVLATLYVRAAEDARESDRAAAAQAAVAWETERQLGQAQLRQAAQAATIADLQAKMLDPQGYELIKLCVRSSAELERALREATRQTPGGVVDLEETILIPDGAGMQCLEAEKYLK
ncbi:MAG: hypothetical protein HKP61_04355, partial [Dactylosporangium sp.]|nr:hypothetical protein [Dactylosporangium sp.]NNJ60185.1 hypothetical protein [Dactylosporangium sp.]